MTEPKPLPSETRLVETPRTNALIARHTEESKKPHGAGYALVQVTELIALTRQLERELSSAQTGIAVLNGIIRVRTAALASLADELRLAQTELKGCYRLIDELKEELRLAREALKQAAEMLQASLPYWQTDERGNGPDCTPVLQAILKANAALKEPL